MHKREHRIEHGGVGLEACNFRNFSQFSCNCFLLVPLVCSLVPCVSPVQRCCPLMLREVWVRHRNFSATFPQFPAIFRNSI